MAVAGLRLSSTGDRLVVYWWLLVVGLGMAAAASEMVASMD